LKEKLTETKKLLTVLVNSDSKAIILLSLHR
jgi:hypothetical protein